MPRPKKTAPRSVADVAESARTAQPAQPSSSKGKSWFESGYESVGAEVRRRDKQQEEWKNQVKRFWMPVEDEKTHKPVVAQFVFIDGIPFTYREHNFFIDGSWKHWKTCMIGTGHECVYDAASNKNYFVGAYTVIDTRSWTAKDGTVHQNEVVLYPAKGDALKALRILADSRGGDLAGCVFNVSRSGDKSPNMGNVFDFQERLPVRKIKIRMTGFGEREITVLDTLNAAVAKRFGVKQGVQLKPYDYASILAPLSREDALAWMGAQNIQAGSGGTESSQEVAY